MAIDKQVLNFVAKHRVSSLTTMLPGSVPHAAALHYSYSDKPFELFFSIENTSKKYEGLQKVKIVKGSVVIGFSEEEWITFQMDGEVVVISSKKELDKVQKIHYLKHPNSEKYKDDPATVFLKLIPNWWRYTDYNTKPETIFSSTSQ